MDVNIHPDVFNKAFLPLLNCLSRLQIFFGGSSSGKSVFLAQRCVVDILKGGRNYLVIRNVGKTIRSSAYAEIKKVIDAWGVGHLFKINKTDMTFTCANGYSIQCKGLDDIQKLKSITCEKGVITDIWLEEATEIKLEDFKELKKRLRGKAGVPKRVHMSFNPIVRTHWIFQGIFAGIFDDGDRKVEKPDLMILKTTYKDNLRFLEKDDIKELEDETDPYYHNVYTLGNWGILGDVIFKNWRVDDLTEMIPTFDRVRNGLDFGYAVSPTAITRSNYYKARGQLYVFEGYQALGMTNKMTAEVLLPWIGDQYIVCDSAEPKSIAELVSHGVNAVAAIKGPDSVRFGIQWLQQQEIIVHKEFQDMINEFTLAQWRKNRQGDVMKEPVDKHNHHISGLRYSYEHEMGLPDEPQEEIVVAGSLI